MSSNLLNMVGLAKKAGKLEVGEEPVGAAARGGQAKLIIVAADAADNTSRRASHFADAGRVKCLCVPFTKAEMGTVLGRSSCAMAAFTDFGFAAALVNKLAAMDPEQYGEAAAQLDTKAQKVLQRMREQRVHEKRLREGKGKPWAAPPARKQPEAPARKQSDAPASKQSSPRPQGKITVKKK